MLNDLYFKTTCNIRPHFLGPMGGLKIYGPLYMEMCTDQTMTHTLSRPGSRLKSDWFTTFVFIRHSYENETQKDSKVPKPRWLIHHDIFLFSSDYYGLVITKYYLVI